MTFEKLYKIDAIKSFNFYQRNVNCGDTKVDTSYYPKLCKVILERALRENEYDFIECENLLQRILR